MSREAKAIVALAMSQVFLIVAMGSTMIYRGDLAKASVTTLVSMSVSLACMILVITISAVRAVREKRRT